MSLTSNFKWTIVIQLNRFRRDAVFNQRITFGFTV